MRLFFIALFVFSLATAHAQVQQQEDPLQQRIKIQLGELLFANSTLSIQAQQFRQALEALQKENTDLKAQIEELKKIQK